MNTNAAITQRELEIIRLALRDRAERHRRQARSRGLSGPENAGLRRSLRAAAYSCDLLARGLGQLEPGALVRVQRPAGGVR